MTSKDLLTCKIRSYRKTNRTDKNPQHKNTGIHIDSNTETKSSHDGTRLAEVDFLSFTRKRMILLQIFFFLLNRLLNFLKSPTILVFSPHSFIISNPPNPPSPVGAHFKKPQVKIKIFTQIRAANQVDCAHTHKTSSILSIIAAWQ